MGRQLWLADALRAGGCDVVEVPGWKTRGGTDYTPRGVIIHETRGSATSTDAAEINVMINGREGLPGPIAQLYLSRSGTWHVVTAGRSNHVLIGWAGPFEGLGNHDLLGIEAQHAAGEPWTPLQRDSYVRGVAALLAHTHWPAPVGHKEHQPGAKTDPGFNMDDFRRRVAAQTQGDLMRTEDLLAALDDPRVAARLRLMPWQYKGTAGGVPVTADAYRLLNEIHAASVGMQAELVLLRGVIADLAELPSADGRRLDVAGILAGMDTRLTEFRAQIDADRRDALGDLAEGGAAQVRADEGE